ncbi:Fc.00g022060.m01.CDS01 [Cosmosporella sp. VM-42]
MAFQLVSVLAALALGVTASPLPDSSLLKRDNSICSRIDPHNGAVCAKPGYVKDESQRWPLPVLKGSVEGCAELCASTETCGFFMYRDSGLCQLFAHSISDAGFFDDSSSLSMWYQMECFACQQAVLNLDFEDTDAVDGWSLTMVHDGSHFMDIQNTYTAGGQTSHALRIGEATDDGYVRVEWNTELNVQAYKTYRLNFIAKSSAPTTNWDLVTITIDGTPKDLYKSSPENGADIGDGWMFFEGEFMVPGDWNAHADFWISIDPSGQQLDWYFDEFTIVSKQ